MKYLKSYKIFESIIIDLENELGKYGISEFIVNENGTLDIQGSVSMHHFKFNEIPFNFNKITGSFNINGNNLILLKHCPKYIGSWFNCSKNKLTSLEYGPEYVGDTYICSHNKLITLNGCVQEIHNGKYIAANTSFGGFDCSYNQLTSLEFCPMEVNGDFDCSYNQLVELDRSPFVRGNLWCYGMFKTKPIFNGDCKHVEWLG